MKLKKLLCAASLCMVVAGCSSKPTTADVDLNKVSATVYEKVESGEIEVGMMSENLDATALMDLYGIDSKDLENYDVRMALINVQATEIAMFEAKEGKLDAVKKGVEKRLEDLKALWSQYLPDQYELVKNNLTYENGNYYFFIVGQDAKKVLDSIKANF